VLVVVVVGARVKDVPPGRFELVRRLLLLRLRVRLLLAVDVAGEMKRAAPRSTPEKRPQGRNFVWSTSIDLSKDGSPMNLFTAASFLARLSW